ncbi:MAG TPA: hypothetical protein VHQ47_20190 [Phycisphaerae bacterium]|jgi:hypothetical protein|nr:hypothetical protein [Phycisphaerae bacterium]
MMKRLTIMALGVGLLGAAAGVRGQVIGNGGGNAAVGTSLTVSTLSTGSVLDVTGAVSADGRYVTMHLAPSQASLEGFDTFTNGLGISQAVSTASIPFRPMVLGKVTLVETDKALLTKPVRAVVLKNVSLKAALRQMAANAGTNIVLGIRGLQEVGVDVDAPHVFLVREGTLKQALLGILKEAAPDQDMVIAADEGVVEVETQGQADNTVVTRSYDLNDLLANLPRIVPPTMDLNTLKEDPAPAPPERGLDPVQADPRNERAGPGKAAKAARNHVPAAPQDSDTDILRLITASVRPEIWKSNGGKIGDISIAGDRVWVTAPQSVQAILSGPSHHHGDGTPMYIGVSQ